MGIGQERSRYRGRVGLATLMTVYRVFHKGTCASYRQRVLAYVTFCSLASLLPQHHISFVDPRAHKEEPRPLEYADDTTIASSMLGQPPSKFDGDDNERESHAGEDDLATDLRAIWSKAGCDGFEIILQDGIDESKTLLFGGEGVPDSASPSF